MIKIITLLKQLSSNSFELTGRKMVFIDYECNRILFCCKLLLLVMLFLVLPSQVFGFYPFTLPDLMMVSRVMKTLFHIDRFSCIHECHIDENCFSFNFEPSTDGKGLCELNKCGVEDNHEREKSLMYTRGVLFQQIRPSQVVAKVHNDKLKICFYR